MGTMMGEASFAGVGASLGLLLALGCSGGTHGSGPASGVGGSGGDGGGLGNIAGSVGGGQAPCVGSKPAPVAAAGHVEIPVRVTANHMPMTIGAPGTGRDGRQYRLSLFKFFLAEPALVGANGQETKAQFVGADGAPLPYDLALIDADDPTTQLLRIAAPQGAYTALRFGVGVPAACNAVSNTDRVAPLNPDSDMFWVWGSQFMFIRIEGASLRPPATEWSSFEYHIGFDPSYASITVPGSVNVGTSGTGPTLSLEVDRMLATDMADLPPPSHTLPDGSSWVVHNLESEAAFALQ